MTSKPSVVLPKDKLLRKGSHSKMALKEKIVQIYEALFRGEDPSTGNQNFWDEFFLLRVNAQYLENEIEKLNGEQVQALKETINSMIYHSIETLKDEHPIRAVNAMHTISALIHAIFQKSSSDHGFDIINVLIGFDIAEAQMQILIERLNQLLTSDRPLSLKSAALSVLMVLITAKENVSQNMMLEYVMINSVFESVVQILGNPESRSSHGHDAILLLTLLVQYRKYESANPYIVKLSILDDELALHGFAQIVSSLLTDFNRQYRQSTAQPEGGFFASLTNMVGSMFVAEEKKTEAMKANDAVLLALYEAIHLNRNFITTLTQSHTPSTPTTPPSSPASHRSGPDLNSPNNLPSDAKPDLATLTDSANQPTNLLVTFLEYCSIVMQDIKDVTRFNNAKLCLIILTIIAEDQYANSLMHDVNMNYRVPLHKMPMRHRKVTVDMKPASRPLASALLDLIVEFTQSHMMKNIPLELYLRSLGIAHRILCYQKKCRVRLQYPWKELWTALINLLKFVMSNESHLLKKHDIFHLSSQMVNIFNLFITFGDTFLPNPSSYDELYYEIIRMHQVFDNLYSMALRYTTTEGQWKESAVKLTNTLVNVRAIINHFSPKVDSWAAANSLSSLTEDQVLEVVRSNYDTLTLKLQENLDQYERYSEKPKEASFFTQMVRQVISDYRKSYGVTGPKSALQELPS
ncbi:hypothetical protein CAPTEDRAFT_224372 [Capitella teleta]|uniref:Armadillo-like helical domain-containing protein n=1 Tax=Capitella teleta TaxID=283909 RepID=R7UND4_CAPTE|nr:hypothetical protein CAPTEDRAFT_224372 [Capitella teleta]|eukprot:ELU05457.1 hypothetical protein CAPTEDRAFT_224372 [Capitella teleta]